VGVQLREMVLQMVVQVVLQIRVVLRQMNAPVQVTLEEITTMMQAGAAKVELEGF
jgi:hypothetical protein